MRQWGKAGLALVFVCLLSSSACSSSNAGTAGADSRDMTGELSPTSLPAPSLVKNQTLSCTDLSVCCAGYDGTLAVAAVDSDCAFTLTLPLDNFCYCAVFNGADDDGNGCPDDYLASMGCAENNYSGAIPIFADADGSTDAIDLGEGSVENIVLVVSATGNPCAQVDQNGDGEADSEDNDNDGDGTLDVDDIFNALGACENLDELDSDASGTPDIFESIFSSAFSSVVKNQTLADFLDDTDDDGIPDGCDVTFGCEADDTDTDGDCIPDNFDFCFDDADEDGFGVCFDCDDEDSDFTASIECYTSFCEVDNDGDGIGACEDCNDGDADTAGIDEDGACPDFGTADCTSDSECQILVSAAEGDETFVTATLCNTTTGECETHCDETTSVTLCVSTFESQGASCDDLNNICSFPPAF